mgnify:CR=1 FL=1
MRILHLFIIIVTNLQLAYANELRYETSPYLQQHKNNPIDWYAYNDKTLKLAVDEDKPIFLSIGYSTCHWCHVMAEESFENEELAKLFNRYFISIKVDKEEMPHLDSYYQTLHKINKNHPAGWPINIFMTPDKKVYYMSGYIPPKSKDGYLGFDKLLVKLSKSYKDKSFIVYKDNKKILHVDKKWDDFGLGFGEGAKFPEVSRIDKLLDNGDIRAYELLDVMGLKGLYDHVDGGFFRYTVDSAWEIPHFEKMLYNQAELIGLYTRAYLLSKKPLYKEIVQETIAMSDRVFLKDGLYFSASDAVSDGEEGGYFIFSKKELEDAKALKYGVLFNGKYHLNFEGDKRVKEFYNIRDKLKDIRSQREYLFIDKKINTAWNALMIEALYEASQIDKTYTMKADEHLKKLTELMFEKGELYHQTLFGIKPKQKGFLEDYSFMISALLAGYKRTKDEDKLGFANYLLSRAKYKFYRDGVWYASDDKLNIKASMESTHYTSPAVKMEQNILDIAKFLHK